MQRLTNGPMGDSGAAIHVCPSLYVFSHFPSTEKHVALRVAGGDESVTHLSLGLARTVDTDIGINQQDARRHRTP